MVCVCPPHTSISLYCRPGSHSSAIFAARACALSAERNSSTKRITAPSTRFGMAAGLPVRPRKPGRCLSLVDLGQREAHVNEDPFAGLGQVVGEQADIDHPPDPADVDPGQVGLIGQELDHLAWDAKAHAITSCFR